MVGFYFARESIDFSTKGSEGVVMTTIQDHFLSELPQPFNQVQVWRIRRQEQQFDIQTLGQKLYKDTPMELSQGGNAPFQVNGHIPLRRGPRYTGQLGCLMVRYFLADQPQNFHPLLDSWIGMLKTLVSKNLQILRGKKQPKPLSHHGHLPKKGVTISRGKLGPIPAANHLQKMSHSRPCFGITHVRLSIWKAFRTFRVLRLFLVRGGMLL